MVIEFFYFNCFLAFANLLHKIEFYLRFDTVLDCFLRYTTFCFFKTSYKPSQNELLQIGFGRSLSTSDGSKHITNVVKIVKKAFVNLALIKNLSPLINGVF